jgi:hypothetical protein
MSSPAALPSARLSSRVVNRDCRPAPMSLYETPRPLQPSPAASCNDGESPRHEHFPGRCPLDWIFLRWDFVRRRCEKLLPRKGGTLRNYLLAKTEDFGRFPRDFL